MAQRPDALRNLRIRSCDDLPLSRVRGLFSEPASAIDALTAEYLFLWDRHRTDDFALRVIGGLDLRSRAYFQWIGYSYAVVVECSSNTYLSGAARLTEAEEQRLVACGFTAPDDDDPNFWLAMTSRAQAQAAAFSVVAALTSVFGVYAG